MTGHERGLRCLFVKDDRLYSGSEDNSLIVWDKMTGERLAKLVGHTRAVISVFVDEGRIYTGSEDNTIRIWNLQTGALIHSIEKSKRQSKSTKVKHKKIIFF